MRLVLRSVASIVIMAILFAVLIIVSHSKSFAGDDKCCTIYNSPGNPFQCCAKGNCTWWAAFMRPEVSGPCRGNANVWLTQAADGHLPTGDLPGKRSIAVWETYPGSSVGHVAYVESVNPDASFNVSEMACPGWDCMRKHPYPAGNATGFIWPATFNGSWVSQTPTDPSGILHLVPNEIVNCSFIFKNNGSGLWTNNGSSPYYVELHSVNSTWDQDQASILAYNWIGGSNVKIATTTGKVDPEVGQGRYSFTIKTPPTPGHYTLYVALYHPHSANYISNTGVKIEIEVESRTYTASFDDFNDGNYNGWQVSGPWDVVNGMLHCSISGQQLWPTAIVGNQSWTNYTFEVDFMATRGVDKSFRFRRAPGKDYGMNIRSNNLGDGGLVELASSEKGQLILITNYDTPRNQWYHLKVILQDERIQIYVKDQAVPVIDYYDVGTNIKAGGIDLVPYTGSYGECEIYYDNVKVTYTPDVLVNNVLSNLPPDYTPQLGGIYTINPGEKKILQLFIDKVAQFFRFFLNWPGSELNLKVYKPNGTLFGEWQDTIPPIEMEVPVPDTGLWNFEVTAVDVPDSNYPFAAVVGSKPITWLAGDVNGDSSVSVSDVVYLVNYLFKNGPSPKPILYSGDVNCSYSVSVSDAVYLINYLFKNGPALCSPP